MVSESIGIIKVKDKGMRIERSRLDDECKGERTNPCDTLHYSLIHLDCEKLQSDWNT